MRRLTQVMTLIVLAVLASCVGTTGSSLVTFRLTISGPPDAREGEPLEIDSGRGYHVTLTRAVLHVGAVFLNRSTPIKGSQATSCILPGIYVGQVVPPLGGTGLDVDVLSPTPQTFPALGTGTADHAEAGEVWLTGGDVNAAEDPTIILDVAGTAVKGTASFSFEGKLTIGNNRAIDRGSTAQPGAHPICKQRIATPIKVDLIPSDQGELRLVIDPRAWFANVEFSDLAPKEGDPSRFVFADDDSDAASRNLFLALHAQAGVYGFSWRR
jgi:hypothetical protein